MSGPHFCSFKKLISMGWLFSALLAMCSLAYAQTLYYDGSDTSLLSTDPIDGAGAVSLFPSSVSNNTVTVTNGTISDYVYGGIKVANSSTAISVTGNAVVISGGTIGTGVHGGYAYNDNSGATASNNTVIVTGGNPGEVRGGNVYSNTGTAFGAWNRVAISGGYLSKVYGANVFTYWGTASAENNKVVISGGSSEAAYGGYAVSRWGSLASASENSVAVSGGTVRGDLYGGWARANRGVANAVNNTVAISGGNIAGKVIGGYAEGSTSSIAENNLVAISGGTVGGDVYGGQVASSTGAVSASNNAVTITGGSVTGDIYGGYATGSTSTASATGNTVTISGNPTFGVSSLLAGGDGSGGTGSDFFSNNRLNIWNYTGSSVYSVKNFQYFNFLLPASFNGGSGAALTIADELSLTDGTNSSTIEAVNFLSGGQLLQSGDTLRLLSAGSISGTITNNGQTITGKKGAAVLYNLLLNQSGNAITATVTGSRANPQMKAVSEGHASGTAMVNQGADLAAGQGMASAVSAARGASQGGGVPVGGFGAVSAGSVRYNTGSHVDLSGFSLLAGLAVGKWVEPGYLTLAPFFEAGSGAYNTYNSFSDAATVKGDGNTSYMGGGLLARMDFIYLGPGHFYAEGSGRMGSVHNRYNNNDLQDGFGQHASFTTDVPYYGLHAGAGYVWEALEALSVDMYAKYFWTRQQANSVTLSTGDPVSYESADSNRLRLGARMTYALNARFSPYLGAAYEREFSGKSEATTYGLPITAPSMRGDTGIGEVGVSVRPSVAVPFTLDLGVQGYAGKREGLIGSLQAKYEF